VFAHLAVAEEKGYLRRVRRYNSSSILRPTAPGWKKSGKLDATYAHPVRQKDQVVQPARFQESDKLDSTYSVTSSPNRSAGASANSPEGSQPLRDAEGSYVCPKCGTYVFYERGACGACDYQWADPPPPPERQRRASRRGADSSVVVDLSSIRKAGGR
jgi:hypothetical protein